MSGEGAFGDGYVVERGGRALPGATGGSGASAREALRARMHRDAGGGVPVDHRDAVSYALRHRRDPARCPHGGGAWDRGRIGRRARMRPRRRHRGARAGRAPRDRARGRGRCRLPALERGAHRAHGRLRRRRPVAPTLGRPAPVLHLPAAQPRHSRALARDVHRRGVHPLRHLLDRRGRLADRPRGARGARLHLLARLARRQLPHLGGACCIAGEKELEVALQRVYGALAHDDFQELPAPAGPPASAASCAPSPPRRSPSRRSRPWRGARCVRRSRS